MTSGTCDIHVEVNGVRTNLINFGTVPASGAATADAVMVPFSFVPDMTSQACIDLTAGHWLDISWNRGGFLPVKVDGSSVSPQGTRLLGVKGSGEASDAFVLREILNSAYPNVDPSQTNYWLTDELLNGDINYAAAFYPGTTPGDFRAAAAWVVSYE